MSPIINTLPEKKTRIAVAMSGGVDSSVAAYLLAKAGHEIVGFTAWTLNGPGKCCNDALVNAGRVCETLGVKYDTVDLRAEFAHFVMDYYNNSYEAGLTPNPCVECNRYVKWEKLVEYAMAELDVDYVATGHYAKLDHSRDFTRLFRSRDEHKDQTYMMTRVHQQDLQKTLFPLGDMVKSEVYALAREFDMPTAHSKESQDICFVLDGQANYMKQVFGSRPGPIVDIDTGKTLGEHEGHFRYTMGQRRGVNVAAGRPIYVIKTDPATNTVYVGDKHHLEQSVFRVKTPHWIHPAYAQAEALPFEAMVKIRYNTPPSLGTVEADPDVPDTLRVTLAAPQSAITPGQIAAFYDPTFSELLGGGYVEQHLIHQPFDPARRDNLPNLFCELEAR